ncbi:hypothetical protein ACFFX0_01080 [Citricoccus parietis]|uniref:Uncharacterized protein n=1 Tax=Citricoccus parietis TaxID=592307 RepID=A0ABV5FT59_9MICC
MVAGFVPLPQQKNPDGGRLAYSGFRAWQRANPPYRTVVQARRWITTTSRVLDMRPVSPSGC